MTYDEFVKLGKEAGFTGEDGEEVAVKIGRFAKLVEQATLERAAKECERTFFGNAGELNHEIAEAIRALKDSNG